MLNKKSIGDKRKLASLVSRKAEEKGEIINTKTILTIFESIDDVVIETLNNGYDIVIPGKVKLYTKERKKISERKNKHPRNGTPTVFNETPARMVLKAKPLDSTKKHVEYNIK